MLVTRASAGRFRLNITKGLTVKVFKVCQLDALPHAEQVCAGAEAIDQHPHVACVQNADLDGGFGASVAITLQRVLNIGPGSNDGTQEDEAEGKECKTGHRATEPEHLAIGRDDNGQVLEDGVNGNGEKLDCFAACIDHTD